MMRSTPRGLRFHEFVFVRMKSGMPLAMLHSYPEVHKKQQSAWKSLQLQSATEPAFRIHMTGSSSHAVRKDADRTISGQSPFLAISRSYIPHISNGINWRLFRCGKAHYRP